MLAGLVPCVLHREGAMESKTSLCQVLIGGGGRRGRLGALTHMKRQKHRNELAEQFKSPELCSAAFGNYQPNWKWVGGFSVETVL